MLTRHRIMLKRCARSLVWYWPFWVGQRRECYLSKWPHVTRWQGMHQEEDNYILSALPAS